VFVGWDPEVFQSAKFLVVQGGNLKPAALTDAYAEELHLLIPEDDNLSLINHSLFLILKIWIR